MQYAWLIWSLIFLFVWVIIYTLNRQYRKEMLTVSLWTMLFGFTEPLFVPEYWNPPSLFNLAANTGFDIESFIFTFSVGGIGSIIYKLIFKSSNEPFNNIEKQKHKLHQYAIISPAIIFLLFAVFSDLNHIYCGIIAMFLGAVAALICRPDLKFKIIVGGLLFLIYYFIFFEILNVLYPGFVQLVWNLKALSGIFLIGIPVEELAWGFTFGMYWSSIYEHFSWNKLKNNK
ncbi:MAG TPA: lycopene cyclase domain-containing protein [Ignavibacteria bacterium]|nr:lycopene cyclase domain-containing protein [Ignavibacteria bacterium]